MRYLRKEEKFVEGTEKAGKDARSRPAPSGIDIVNTKLLEDALQLCVVFFGLVGGQDIGETQEYHAFLVVGFR